jgi:ABC-type transport system involved in multi-copper enzyme maturation permease subunit
MNDLQRQLYSFKFIVVIIFACLVSGVCVYVNILDFNDRQQNYQAEVIRNQDQIKSFRSYGDFKISILIPPNPLSIFAKGVEHEAGNKVVIEPMELPLPEKTSETTNPFLSIFSYMDITGIVGLILSLLVLLITTDAISGDRESQSLKMIFACSVSRGEYLMSKYVGAFLIAGIPLILIFIMATLMCVSFLSVQINVSFCLGVLSIFCVCLLFLSTFILFGLILSARSASSASSTMNGLFLWCVLTILYPATVNYTITSYIQKPSKIKLEEDIANINTEFFKKHFDYMTKNHHRMPTNSITGESFDELHQAFFMKFVGVTQKYEFERLRNNNHDMLPEYFKSRDQVLSLYDQFQVQTLKPKSISQYFLWFLPYELMQHSNTQLARTDREFRENRFTNSVRSYKQTVMDYLTSKDAFGMKFFSLLPEEEMKDDFSKYSEILKQRYMNKDFPLLELNDIPEFRYPETEGDSVDMLVLLLVNLLLFGLLYRVFMFADLT